MSNGLPIINVTEIGEYIRHSSCERRFKLGANNRQIARDLPFHERLFNPLDPVLQETGRQHEHSWEHTLQKSGFTDLTNYAERTEDNQSTSWDEFVNSLNSISQNESGYAREINLFGEVGTFNLAGRVDFLVIRWQDNQPYLRIVECKASRRDRTYHRLQVALYKKIIEDILELSPIEISGHSLSAEHIECVVARIDEETNQGQSIIELSAIDDELEPLFDDIDRLLSQDGILCRILNANIDDLHYQLNAKCDGCVFNVYCLPESARQRKVELLGIDPSMVRILTDSGITTIDDLVNLAFDSPQARQIRQNHNFTGNLEVLQAKARARITTLPGNGLGTNNYSVEPLPQRWQSQLPEHSIANHQLIRIYMSVDYDYTENRIGALSAHVTRSDHKIHTGFSQSGENWSPNPEISERREAQGGSSSQDQYDTRPIQGREVIQYKNSPWSGSLTDDNLAEQELIQSFFNGLVDAIATVATTATAPIHFYFWSRSEVARLVEACSRTGSQLLGHLRELMGCRESLEQLIFSCVQNEVDNRYALGWTGRGLAVVTSLSWFGTSYHWCRLIGGVAVDLDNAFTQDLFDFKTDLFFDENNNWVREAGPSTSTHKFEVRSRFHDSLPAPYWHAQWGTLPDPEDTQLDGKLRNAIRRYNTTAQASYLTEYLRARVHALRWVEERIAFKNADIIKPLMNISQLPNFSLNVDNTVQAALDFLRLEQHVRVTDWAVSHLEAPITRVSSGRTIPIRNVRASSDEPGIVIAELDLDNYDITIEELEVRTKLSNFARLTPCSDDPNRNQTLGQLYRAGSTCVIENINWDTGAVRLSIIPMRQSDRYRLLSLSRRQGTDIFQNATLDESPSDFPGYHVDNRLLTGVAPHINNWFDPTNPQVPQQTALDNSMHESIRNLIEGFDIGNNNNLAADQIAAVMNGINTRIQLLQGPPGTGKTTTTAVAVLTRILARHSVGDVVLIGANTHTAVDALLESINSFKTRFRAFASQNSLTMPNVQIAKVHSSNTDNPVQAIDNLVSGSCRQYRTNASNNSVLILGGTTGALLKMASRSFRGNFEVASLIVDEASMMVFPHFLSLASLVSDSGTFMLSGDHRQLAPILSHDWECEDRPPTVLYQPFVSAYDAVRNLSSGLSDTSIRNTALSYSFRLPEVIRSLIAQLYRHDNIELDGRHDVEDEFNQTFESPWDAVWSGETGLFWIVHNERYSKQSNETEVSIIQEILSRGQNQPASSIAVMTPHRSQRTMLQTSLGNNPAVDLIDTVERLQGGERPTVIFSATVSDPVAIETNVEFILDLNRSNVAFSRAQQRLIVVCSESLINHIPAELEHYESTMLWKSLRSLCSHEIARTQFRGYLIRVMAPARRNIQQL